MRARGIDAPVFGTDRLAHPQFLELAGEAAEGVEAAVWTNPPMDDPGWLAFDKRYRERFGAAPDLFAAYAYDATRLVVATIRSEGLNRARIRDALTAIREYRGVTGTMIFDATSNNVTPVATMRVRGGRLVQE
jgi:branched-chain amino acid transport system substrate-binding protein